MRAEHDLGARHAATELPARTCGKLLLRCSAPERRTVSRSLVDRSLPGHGAPQRSVERGSSCAACLECTTAAPRAVPTFTFCFATVRRRPNASRFSCGRNARAFRILRSTAGRRSGPHGRAPVRAPASCNRLLGRSLRILRLREFNATMRALTSPEGAAEAAAATRAAPVQIGHEAVDG